MLRMLVLGAALGAGAGPASAATVTATFEGTVSGGSDATGEFGLPGEALDGLAFTAAFVFDTERGQRDATATDDGLLGGLLVGIENPLLAAQIVINGVTQSFSGEVLSLAFTEAGSLFQALAFQADTDGPTDVERELDLSLASAGIPGSLDVPFALLGDAVPAGASFTLSELAEDGTVLVDAFGDLDVDRLTVTVDDGPAPIPLPAPGLLLGGALALAGVAARARLPQA